MRYGMSAAAIIVRDGRVLLVNHRGEEGHSPYDFWVAPGGGLEGDETIMDCARREAFEETGLKVLPQRIAYVWEYFEPGYHFCKFFIFCREQSGTLTRDNRTAGEDFLVDVRFFAPRELAGLDVKPPEMWAVFWDDLAAGFTTTRYLGILRRE